MSGCRVSLEVNPEIRGWSRFSFRPEAKPDDRRSELRETFPPLCVTMTSSILRTHRFWRIFSRLHLLGDVIVDIVDREMWVVLPSARLWRCKFQERKRKSLFQHLRPHENRFYWLFCGACFALSWYFYDSLITVLQERWLMSRLNFICCYFGFIHNCSLLHVWEVSSSGMLIQKSPILLDVIPLIYLCKWAVWRHKEF